MSLLDGLSTPTRRCWCLLGLIVLMLGVSSWPVAAAAMDDDQQQQQPAATTKNGAPPQEEGGGGGETQLQRELLLQVAAPSNTKPQPKIVGGTLADYTEYPWYVVTLGAEELCGGTLIAPDVVLSAAHCFAAFTHEVLVGANHGMNIDGKALARTFVQTVYQHPNYTPGTEDNDIMLIKLTQPVLDSNNNDEPTTNLVTLNWDPALPIDGMTVSVVGFGQTAEGGSVSNDLLVVHLDNVGLETCQALLPDIQPFHMCAGVPKGGADSCGGDSGGPMLDSLNSLQYGVVSFGFGCGRENSPGVNTRVSWYKDWITNYVCNESAFPPASFDCTERVLQKTDPPSPDTTDPPTAMPTPLSGVGTGATAPPTTEDEGERQGNNTAATIMPTMMFDDGNATNATIMDDDNTNATNATDIPVFVASAVPTSSPQDDGEEVTGFPTIAPTASKFPTLSPTVSKNPSAAPSMSPVPSASPTQFPTKSPTMAPTIADVPISSALSPPATTKSVVVVMVIVAMVSSSWLLL